MSLNIQRDLSEVQLNISFFSGRSSAASTRESLLFFLLVFFNEGISTELSLGGSAGLNWHGFGWDSERRFDSPPLASVFSFKYLLCYNRSRSSGGEIFEKMQRRMKSGWRFVLARIELRMQIYSCHNNSTLTLVSYALETKRWNYTWSRRKVHFLLLWRN